MSLTTKGHFSINGEEFVAKEIKVKYTSLTSDDSGKTMDGMSHIYWVLRKIRNVEIDMAPCGADVLSKLFSLVQGQEYSLTYFDPLENEEKTIQAYTANTTATMYSGVLLNGLWQGVSFTATELGGEE